MEKSSSAPPLAAKMGTHYLHPAALFVSLKPHLVTTVLGTCIAVCLWDKSLRMGGINHFMLPYWNGDGLASPKYGNIAMERLYHKMLSLGANPKNMIAKVFGGRAHDEGDSVFNIGERNTGLAFDFLEQYGIEVKAQSVGGPYGRKLQFLSNTGEVRMKYIKTREGR